MTTFERVRSDPPQIIPWSPRRGFVHPQPTFLRRSWAFALDLAVLSFLAWVVALELVSWGVVEVRPLVVEGRNLGEGLGLLWFLALLDLPLTLTYFTLSEGLFGGRTVGKLLLGIRVRRVSDGRPPTLLEAFLRNLLRLLWMSPLGPLFLLADLYLLLADELDRRIGDLAAGTSVYLEGSSKTSRRSSSAAV